ncbi:MAG: hypothetical protein ACE5GW_07160 [Planctomycetota bacterium]
MRLAAILLLSMLAASSVAPGDEPGDNTSLATELAAYLQALESTAVVESAGRSLEVRLQIFPDAWQHRAFTRLSAGLAARRSREEIVQELRKQSRERKRLSGACGFRLGLGHPSTKEGQAPQKPRTVHIFRARLQDVILFRRGRKALRWRGWREPSGLDLATVRLAKHSTVKNGERVPFMAPLKPKGTRAVFRGRKALIWGLLPRSAVAGEEGTVQLTIRGYDRYVGIYGDDHILDMNRASHRLDRDLTLGPGSCWA